MQADSPIVTNAEKMLNFDDTMIDLCVDDDCDNVFGSQKCNLTMEDCGTQKIPKSNTTGSMTNFLLASAKSTLSNGFYDNTTPRTSTSRFQLPSNSSAGRTPIFAEKRKLAVFFFFNMFVFYY